MPVPARKKRYEKGMRLFLSDSTESVGIKTAADLSAVFFGFSTKGHETQNPALRGFGVQIKNEKSKTIRREMKFRMSFPSFLPANRVNQSRRWFLRGNSLCVISTEMSAEKFSGERMRDWNIS